MSAADQAAVGFALFVAAFSAKLTGGLALLVSAGLLLVALLLGFGPLRTGRTGRTLGTGTTLGTGGTTLGSLLT